MKFLCIFAVTVAWLCMVVQCSGSSLCGNEKLLRSLPFRIEDDLLSTLCPPQPQSEQPLSGNLNHAADVMIVFDDIFSFKNAQFSSKKRHIRRQEVYNYLTAHADHSQKAVVDLLTQNNVQHKRFWIVNAIQIDHFTLETLSLLSDHFQKVGSLKNSFLVRKVAQINRISPIESSLPPLATDPQTSSSSSLAWNIQKIQADKCWSAGVNGTGVVVATIDGGVRYTHVALKPSYRGYDASSGKYNHDYNWVDYAYNDSEPSDSEGHGTNVQGVATGSVSSGVGVAPGSKWISAKVFNNAGASDDSWLIAATQWVLCPSPVKDRQTVDCSKGADVVSCSWGFASTHAPSFQQYIGAWVAAGLVPVFAVGNAGPQCNSIAAPSDFTGVLGVGGTDQRDTIIAFSSRGPVSTTGVSGYNEQTPGIVAPGMSIYGPSCESDTAYVGFSGTSQACPHVAGVAALVLSVDSSLDLGDVTAAIYASADSVDMKAPTDGVTSCGNIPWNTFPNYIYGYGRVDALAAVNKAATMRKAL